MKRPYRNGHRAKDRRQGQCQLVLALPHQKHETPTLSKPSNIPTSIFDRRSLDTIYADIQSAYRIAQRPWVVMVSMGKDSTATAQLIWKAIAMLPAEDRTYPVFFICGDTYAEIPIYHARIHTQIDLMNQAAHDHHLPFSAHISAPALKDRLWVCVIGLGYAMPTQRFRWCTERLKIKPTLQIAQAVAGTSRLISVLGVREAESINRASSIQRHRIHGHFAVNTTLKHALNYLPIADWSTDDVWTYLLSVPSPWGADNRQLLTLYRQASVSGGECPLLVQPGTSACGTGRFGCWSCTVAKENASLNALYSHPEYDWLEPLVDLDARLRESTQPERKFAFREVNTSQHTQTKHRADGSPIPGRLKQTFREEILTRLLDAQKRMRTHSPYPDLTLITDQEIRAIRYLWAKQGFDHTRIEQIYTACMQKPLDCPVNPFDDHHLVVVSTTSMQSTSQLSLF